MNAATSNDPFGLVGMLLDGKYRVDRMVAAGGFGVVYAGHHLRLDAPIAIKVLKPIDGTPEERGEALARFIDEARMTARLRHPHIAQVLDTGLHESGSLHGEIAWIVLEWLDGISLRDELERRRGRGGRSPNECWRLLRPVLEAVAHAHEAGVVHRDLKPSNIMLAKTGKGVVVKVLDFGIAKAFRDTELSPTGDTTTRSDRSTFSPRYASPEQVAHTRTGPWTDVHALGLLLSEVLTDAPPYPGGDANELLAMVFDPERPTPLRAGVDVGQWEPIIAKALALKPADRFPNAQALLDALAAALDGAESRRAVLPLDHPALTPPADRGTTRSDPAPSVPDAPPSSATVPASALTAHLPRRRAALAFGAAAVGVAGVLAVLVYALRPKSQPLVEIATSTRSAVPTLPSPAPSPSVAPSESPSGSSVSITEAGAPPDQPALPKRNPAPATVRPKSRPKQPAASGRPETTSKFE